MSVSFPDGVILPVRTSAVPSPPNIPPCQTYITASGLTVSIKVISIMFPTFKSTTTFLNPALTLMSMSYSSAERRYEPAVAELSLSSPAVRPRITMAVSETAAASETIFSVSGISS